MTASKRGDDRTRDALKTRLFQFESMKRIAVLLALTGLACAMQLVHIAMVSPIH